MATYAIGDIQGCGSALRRLVARIGFQPGQDRLWFVGDLVNRGHESLAVLRFIRDLGPAAVTVLGNHDLHLLAVAAGVLPPHRKDTFQDVLTAPDRDDLLAWLRQRPLLYCENDCLLLHAGLLPQWTAPQACSLAQEVEAVLRSADYRDFLVHLYKVGYLSNEGPQQWSEKLTGLERWSLVTNAVTKLRICTPEGRMQLAFKGPLSEVPAGYLPWFEVPGRKSAGTRILFGHWAALGLFVRQDVAGLDSGCVYGRQLTAFRLEDRQFFQVPCVD